MTHLLTAYAPPTFLKPVLIVDTIFNSATKETAVIFVEALNPDHAQELIRQPASRRPHSKVSDWIIVQAHETREAAIAYHLAMVEHFHPAGSDDEWHEGWEPYLAIYERWCPAAMRDPLDALLG